MYVNDHNYDVMLYNAYHMKSHVMRINEDYMIRAMGYIHAHMNPLHSFKDIQTFSNANRFLT